LESLHDDLRSMNGYPDPQPPGARAATGIAALVLLVVVFVAGLAVGQSGLFGRGAAGAPQHTPAPAVSGAPGESPGAEVEPPEDFDLFWKALETVRREFVGRDDLDERELTYGAIRGMIDALGDTGHSVFLTPEEVQSEQNSLDGNVVGIGVILGERDGRVVVVSVVPASPAQRAGMRSGDAIVEVDGVSVEGLAPDQLAARVRGDEGSTVSVAVSRPPDDRRLDFSIVRERIRIPAASWTLIPGTDIGLLRLAQFSAGSADELKIARDSAVAAGATSLILDLRGNPGGYVDQAVRAASLFLSAGTVYVRETADGERIPVAVSEEVVATDLPLVVLIDENTASSAEIMAGALQSADRAPLIGTRTFGTGTVLLHFGLADGSSLRLAIERWLTPDEELIFGRGITPTEQVELGPDDVPVEPEDVRALTPEQVARLADPQLRRAIELALQ
jgi:carboxyl-terminal processing protease